MNLQSSFRSQFHAALSMFEAVVQNCPDTLWYEQTPQNKFWHIAYHTLFYTHLYLQESEASFVPWAGFRENYQFMGRQPWPPYEKPLINERYSKEEILEYVAFCRKEIDARLAALDKFDAPSGFSWLPMNKFELQIYNIRHIQHHVGQLSDRLRQAEDIGVEWLGMGSNE